LGNVENEEDEHEHNTEEWNLFGKRGFSVINWIFKNKLFNY